MLESSAPCSSAASSPKEGFDWRTRTRDGEASTFETRRWEAAQTAFIVCDMWDYHHSVNAVRRLQAFAPRLNEVLAEARRRGATIIHAPSDCMPFYEGHPARKRALEVPESANRPSGIAEWCHRIPEEESAVYPLDQSNGGEDDDLDEHALWAAYLETIGRNPGTPWKRQTDRLSIDSEHDFIAAEGDVVWNVLESRGIRQVVLLGVHVNMCVLGRPFGLRQMKRVGKEVILMRDMTDAMYEPGSWPYVSHFAGLDLVIEHIERHVCPTVTSDQVLGGQPFRFREDRRPRVAILWAPLERGHEEAGKRKEVQLLQRQLVKTFQVLVTSGPGPDLESAEVLVVPSAEWHSPAIEAFAASGRPVVREVDGARRAHGPPLQEPPTAPPHEVAKGLDPGNFPALHPKRDRFFRENSALTKVVLGSPEAPRAWIRVRPDGGRSFEMMPSGSVRGLINGCYWAADLAVPDRLPLPAGYAKPTEDWVTRTVGAQPGLARLREASDGEVVWWRCQVKLSPDWEEGNVFLDLSAFGGATSLFWNGEALESDRDGRAKIGNSQILRGQLQTVAIRQPVGQESPSSGTGCELRSDQGRKLSLEGRWQARMGDDPAWATLPIPPQFGASTDHLFETQVPSKSD